MDAMNNRERFELRSTDEAGNVLWVLCFATAERAEAALMRILMNVHRTIRQHLEVVDVLSTAI